MHVAVPISSLLVAAFIAVSSAVAADLIFPAAGSTQPHYFEWRLYSAPSGAGHTEFFDIEAQDIFARDGWVRVGSGLTVAELCQTAQTRKGPVTLCWFAMPQRAAYYRVRACSAVVCSDWVEEPTSELIGCCSEAPAPEDVMCYTGLTHVPADCRLGAAIFPSVTAFTP